MLRSATIYDEFWEHIMIVWWLVLTMHWHP